METFGALEFWELRESPDLVGTDAKKDIPLPRNVRRYFFPGTSHGGGRGGFNAAAAAPPNGCVLPANPNPESDTMKALTAALVDWVTKGKEPPASNHPRLDRGELAPAEEVAQRTQNSWSACARAPSESIGRLRLQPRVPLRRFVGHHHQKEPPVIKQSIATLVPKVDADGSDVGGVPSVLRQAPLGSYLGWSRRPAASTRGSECTLSGGYIPFARTKAERTAKGDPRLSLEEAIQRPRWLRGGGEGCGGEGGREGFLLRDDAGRLIAQATASDVLANQ